MSDTGEIAEFPVVRVFSFKEGLLSRFAHDLQLALTDFEIELARGKLTGVFRTTGVVVEGVIVDGKLDPKMLSGSDCKKILKNVAEDVLQSDRFPDARLEAAVSTDDDGLRIDGTLTLFGRRLACPTVRPAHVGHAWIATLEVTPSRWGIRPYKAMAGALKVRDLVRIEVALPVEEDFDHEAGERRWKMRARRG